MTRDLKSITVHMIGNAHLDPVWLWRWTEGYEALLSTFRAALDFIAETDDLIFTTSSAMLYEWIEETEPVLFGEIRERIQQGRWSIVGGWWLEPDCNLPCGESLARQALYGQRYFREKFGVMASVGYNVDTFGHAGTLPQLLKSAGLDSYIFFRPGRHEKELPEEMFWWESPDGSRVLACRPPGLYGQGIFEPENTVERICDHAGQAVDGLQDVVSFYGIGNHGGGPTRAQLAAIDQVDADPESPQTHHSDLASFFRKARAQRQDFPVLRDELLHHARGCYSVHTHLKRWNRESEALLITAEMFATLASELTALNFPHRNLTQAWKDVLFNQFHDIITGTAEPEAIEDARDLYGEARSLATRALWNALQSISRKINTRGGGHPIIAFNPLPWTAPCGLQVRLPFDFQASQGPYEIQRYDGTLLPTQSVQGTSLTGSRSDQLALVDTLPPLGYQVYYLNKTSTPPAAEHMDAGRAHLENRYWRLELDPFLGHITELYDKRNDVHVFRGAAAVPLVVDDHSDTWGHGVDAYGDLIGRFGEAQVRLEENGPVRATLRASTRFGNSHVTQRFRLYANLDRIEVDVEIDWREQLRMLKLAFPVSVKNPQVTASVPYGCMPRDADGDEQPCGPWIDVTGESAPGEPYGLSIITDNKHAYSALGSELRVTVVRSPIYAWHAPWTPKEERAYRFMDQGYTSFSYWLLPHAGSWQDTSVVRESLAINRPPLLVNEYSHAGTAPPAQRSAEAGPDNVILSVFKRSEHGDGVVLRLWETSGRDTRAWVQLPCLGTRWEGTLRGHEIRTLRARRTPGGWVWDTVNLLEFMPNNR